MTAQTRLLVLVDGSERTIETVRYISGFMPDCARMQVVLFHVFLGLPEELRELEQAQDCDDLARQLKSQESEERQGVLARLQQARQILVDGGVPEANVEIKFQPVVKGVARDIIEEARRGYTAVVLRRRGLGAIKNIILGSVAVKLLQSLAFLPIILVGRTPPTKKVLLAVDSSPHSRKAVEFAAAFLGGHGYEARLFHAIEGLGALRFELTEGHCPEAPDEEEARSCITAFKAKLARLFHIGTAILVEAGFKVGHVSRRVVSGVHNRAEAIVAEAEAEGCSTVIVGRRGLSRVDAFFMGRVSHAVVYAGNHLTVWVV